jgi:hypothetical protein
MVPDRTSGTLRPPSEPLHRNKREGNPHPLGATMTTISKEMLVQKIQEILRSDDELNFLFKLRKEELEKLIASIRHRVEHDTDR